MMVVCHFTPGEQNSLGTDKNIQMLFQETLHVQCYRMDQNKDVNKK